MSDATAAAVPDPEPAKLLPNYGRRKVLRTTISVRNAGDGLSEGLAIDPVLYPIGARIQVVLDGVVTGHNHKPLRGKDANYLEVDQVFTSDTGVVVDGELVAEVLERQRTKLSMAAEAKAGVGHLPDTGYDEALTAAHTDGLHADGPVPGCEPCQAELDAAAAEGSPGATVSDLHGRKSK